MNKHNESETYVYTVDFTEHKNLTVSRIPSVMNFASVL